MKGLVVGAAGALGAAAGLAAGALLSGPKRVSVLDRGFMAAMGALLSMHALHTAWTIAQSRKRRRRHQDLRDPASFSDYLRGEDAEGQDLPWALREPEEAHALLQAAAAGGMPAGRVERLALLHLLMRMHREAHARTGNPVNALGQAIAQQQFNALVDVMSYEELYEFFGGPPAAEGMSEEQMQSLPLAQAECVDGCVSVGGTKVTDCSVCLEPFEKGQKVRQLPQCAHVFHRSCVDRWLRMHSACPLCRTPL